MQLPESSPFQESSAATRKRIAEAAAQLFSEQGFEKTSVRSIAAAAGADAALVIRYFGSKEDLFLATIQLHRAFEQALQAPLPDLAVQLVGAAVQMRGTRALRVYGVLMRASGNKKVGHSLGEAIEDGMIQPLVKRLQGADARVRSSLIAAQLLGLLDALALRGDEALLAAAEPTLVSVYAPALNALILPVP
ncbi:AcrR family transcriptional regulator [Arthrobacter sp. UYP6]|uniref:TetR/AcrR family transcriptional regulator n=1 Tax=Arthrobacter sp. UYP6 TaxID=1756378 RepID=UPI00339666EE